MEIERSVESFKSSSFLFSSEVMLEQAISCLQRGMVSGLLYSMASFAKVTILLLRLEVRSFTV